MRRLTNRDIQVIDEEIMGRAGKGKRTEIVARLRDIAEVHRVYASRAACLCQDTNDVRTNYEQG